MKPIYSQTYQLMADIESVLSVIIVVKKDAKS